VPGVEDEDLEAERRTGNAEVGQGDQASHPHCGGCDRGYWESESGIAKRVLGEVATTENVSL
jgi:hypothetical protein